jgi:hypothetical protein
MKATYTFHFADEPQRRTIMSRAELANKLRAYRRQPRTYKTVWTYARNGAGAYTVTLHDGSVTAVIERACIA